MAPRSPLPRGQRNTVVAFQTKTSDPKILANFRQLVLMKDKQGVEKKNLIEVLEQQFAAKQGGIARGGSKRLIPDFDLSNSFMAELIASANVDQGNGSIDQAEGKVKQTARDMDSPIDSKSFKNDTTIGGITPSSELLGQFDKSKMLKGGNFNAAYVKKLNVNSGKLLFSKLKKTSDFNEFYEKGKTLQIFQLINGKSSSEARALNIITPKSKFTNPPFFVRLEGTSTGKDIEVRLSLKASYIRDALKETGDFIYNLDDLENESFSKSFASLKRGKAKTGAGKGVKSHTLLVPTNELAVGRKNLKKEREDRRNANTFISAIQLTALVRARLQQTMATTGEADPPLLKNRTGTYIDSINVFPNYKTSRIRYTLAPHYRSLEQYGYIPDGQAIIGIRQVVQQLFTQKFNIVRSN